MTRSISNFRFFGLAFCLIIAFVSISPESVKAQERSYVYESINVTINQNADSTMEVTEELTYRFTGTYFAVVRDISLIDEAKMQKCKEDPALQCGGFESLDIVEVLDNNGNILKAAKKEDVTYDDQDRTITDPDKYIISSRYVDTDKRFSILWVFDREGRDFNNETFKYTIKYKVYGAPNYYDDYDLLYWNAIFSDREVLVENSTITLNYPGPVDISSQSLQLPGQGNNYQLDTQNGGSTVIIKKGNLLPYEGITVLQKLPKGLIQEYASLNLDLSPSDQNLLMNNITYTTDVKDRISGIPPGENTFLFSQDGRISKEFKLNFAPGEEKDLEVVLDLTRAEIIKTVIMIALNILGFSFLPIGIFVIYRLWKNKGRDYSKNKIVVPEYSPPEGIHPYLLGSLKDETVDIKDITSSIIDLAYRGYIKIKEFGSKEVLGIKIKKVDFELIKIKDFADLSEPEKELMDAVFGTKDRMTTNELKNKFYKRLPGIKKKIYEELVTVDYFKESPDSVRTKYIGMGILITIIAGVLIFASFVVPIFIGTAIAIGVLGVVMIVIAKYMPAKTELGSKIFNKVLGFKMYMETAEKYRVQNLTPETFERFLPYAMIFGIEKQWAEKFKDIYKGTPDWYEGDISTFNTIYLVNSLSTFNTTTASAMTVSPSSSGTGSGGGWSGGGGFSGGFSGGGGGGGGGGAW